MWCTVKQRLPFISSLCVINHQKEGDGAGEGKSSCSVQEQTTQLILGSQNFLICCWAAGSTQILSDNALVPSVSLPAFPEFCSPEVPQSGTASLPTKTIDAVAQGGGGEHSSSQCLQTPAQQSGGPETSRPAWEWPLHVSACAVGKQSITWAAEQARDASQTHTYLRHAGGLECCYRYRDWWNN